MFVTEGNVILKAHYPPGAIAGAGETEMTECDKGPCLHGTYILVK